MNKISAFVSAHITRFIRKLVLAHDRRGAVGKSFPKWYRKLVAKTLLHRSWISGRFYWVRSNGFYSNLYVAP